MKASGGSSRSAVHVLSAMTSLTGPGMGGRTKEAQNQVVGHSFAHMDRQVAWDPKQRDMPIPEFAAAGTILSTFPAH